MNNTVIVSVHFKSNKIMEVVINYNKNMIYHKETIWHTYLNYHSHIFSFSFNIQW